MIRTTAWHGGDVYALRARRATLAATIAALASAAVYAALIASGSAEPIVLAPLGVALVVAVIVARPVAGLVLVLGLALLLEQFDIPGISPFTAHTRFYQNLSAYTPIPLRFSIADLLILLTLASAAARHVTRRERAVTGPLAVAAMLYLGAFADGVVIGVARGGFDVSAAFAELRGPVYLVTLTLLAADLVRERRHVLMVLTAFVAVVGIKAVQGIANAAAVAGIASIEAVTGHEDTVFFNAVLALTVVALALGARARLSYLLFAIAPLVLVAELVTERRVGFVGLGALSAAAVILVSRTHPRRALAVAGAGVLAIAIYLPLFWDASGAIAEPIRALRTVLGDPTITVRDQLSDHWREIENANIAFTMRQLPLTGVGVGQEYLFQREPPVPSTTFVYWRFITHNALLWLWLKAGPLGAIALAFLVARATLVGSRVFATLRDPDMRLAAVLPVALAIAQVIFSAVELGLTYSRTMIALGIAFGTLAALRRMANAESVA